jgi:Holliday junction resolvasome RuvABC endonuclease subunit
MIMSLYGLEVQPKFADISDALGIAYVAKAMSSKKL